MRESKVQESREERAIDEMIKLLQTWAADRKAARRQKYLETARRCNRLLQRRYRAKKSLAAKNETGPAVEQGRE